jgi:hypothetical protein
VVPFQDHKVSTVVIVAGFTKRITLVYRCSGKNFARRHKLYDQVGQYISRGQGIEIQGIIQTASSRDSQKWYNEKSAQQDSVIVCHPVTTF